MQVSRNERVCAVAPISGNGRGARLSVQSLMALAAVAMTSGCASMRGSQERLTAADFATDAYVCPSQQQLAIPLGKTTAEHRDDVIALCLQAIENKYRQFTTALWLESGSANLGLDSLSQALSAVASVVDGANTVRRLSAGSAFTQAIGATINKDLFYKQALPALIASMDTRRNKIILGILDNQNNDPTAQHYTLQRAGHDLEQLQQAGSLAAAVQELTTTAVQNKARTDAEVQQAQGGFDIGVAQDLPQPFVDRMDAVQAVVDALADNNRVAALKAIVAELKPVAEKMKYPAPSGEGADQLRNHINGMLLALTGGNVADNDREPFLKAIETAVQNNKDKM